MGCPPKSMMFNQAFRTMLGSDWSVIPVDALVGSVSGIRSLIRARTKLGVGSSVASRSLSEMQHSRTGSGSGVAHPPAHGRAAAAHTLPATPPLRPE